MGEKIRIQKWISQLGVASRREAERLIVEGKVRINGKLITELGAKADPETDKISIGGKAVHTKEPPRVYWMFNKPDGYLTAAKGQGINKCIFDLPKLRKIPFKLSPVGRLDLNTEGLLILSNDGEFVFRLSHPSFKLPRQYQAMIPEKLTDAQLKQVRKGLELEDGPVKKVEITYIDSENLGRSKAYWYMVTVYEGRNRLVRRIFEHLGTKVKRLIRSSFGDINLDLELKQGEYRQLSSKELRYLKKQVDL